jgi:hypothetical protein
MHISSVRLGQFSSIPAYSWTQASQEKLSSNKAAANLGDYLRIGNFLTQFHLSSGPSRVTGHKRMHPMLPNGFSILPCGRASNNGIHLLTLGIFMIAQQPHNHPSRIKSCKNSGCKNLHHGPELLFSIRLPRVSTKMMDTAYGYY